MLTQRDETISLDATIIFGACAQNVKLIGVELAVNEHLVHCQNAVGDEAARARLMLVGLHFSLVIDIAHPSFLARQSMQGLKITKTGRQFDDVLLLRRLEHDAVILRDGRLAGVTVRGLADAQLLDILHEAGASRVDSELLDRQGSSDLAFTADKHGANCRHPEIAGRN